MGTRPVSERVCVGVLLQRGGRILLGKRSATRAFYPDVWDVPGGHVEPGETVEQALARELHEEIGVTPAVWTPLGSFEAPAGSGGTLTLHLFVVTAWQGTPRNLLPEEHAE